MKILAAAVLGAALLSACGASGSAASSAPATSSSSTAPAGTITRGLTAGTITVGGLAPLTSASGATLPGSDIGARAYFSGVDSAGGIAGRKVVFVGITDDGDDPATNLAAARSLVQQSRVFAIVPAVTRHMGSADFLEQQSVPTVGQMFDSLSCQRTYLFGIGGCLAPPVSEGAYSPGPAVVLRDGLFHGAPGRTVAVTADDDTNGHASEQACSQAFSSVGFKVVLDNVFLPVTQGADLTPFAQQIMRAAGGHPPDVVWSCDSLTPSLGLIGALKAAGYPGAIYSPATYDPRLLAVPDIRSQLQGTYAYTQYAPVESSLPAVQRARSAIEASDPGVQISPTILAGYYAAELFSDIARQVGRPLTAEAFAAAGNDNFSFDAGGAVCPVSFPLGHSEGSVGGGLVQVSGGSFKVVAPLICEPMSANVHF